MGRPPDAHSTPAPVGTTAVPGLVPDLIARLPCELQDAHRGVGMVGLVGDAAVHRCTPGPFLRPPVGPRWALVAVAVAVGVLAISCFLCVVCCCLRRRSRGRKKKPRDQEAVGLASPQGTTSTHLVRRGHRLRAAQGPDPGAGGGPACSGGSSFPGDGLVCPEAEAGRALRAGDR